MELLPSVETVLQSIAAGLLVGCTYGLMCVALGLIFGVMRLINFAQGEFLMLGMYFVMSIVTIFGFGSLIGPVPAILVAVVASVPVFFVVGSILHWAMLGRIGAGQNLTEGEVHQAQLIMTLGLSLLLANGTLIVLARRRCPSIRRCPPRPGPLICSATTFLFSSTRAGWLPVQLR